MLKYTYKITRLSDKAHISELMGFILIKANKCTSVKQLHHFIQFVMKNSNSATALGPLA